MDRLVQFNTSWKHLVVTILKVFICTSKLKVFYAWCIYFTSFATYGLLTRLQYSLFGGLTRDSNF